MLQYCAQTSLYFNGKYTEVIYSEILRISFLHNVIYATNFSISGKEGSGGFIGKLLTHVASMGLVQTHSHNIFKSFNTGC